MSSRSPGSKTPKPLTKEEKRAKALRENLLKRKAQQKSRDAREKD